MECVTTFEKMLRGGTIDPDISTDDYHTPISVMKGEKSIQEVNQLRRQLGYMLVSPMIFSPDPTSNIRVGVSLEDVDPETRKTIKDPKAIGVYDPETKSLKESEDPDLNKKFYNRLRENSERFPDYAKEFPWEYARDGKALVLEAESTGDPEKG